MIAMKSDWHFMGPWPRSVETVFCTIFVLKCLFCTPLATFPEVPFPFFASGQLITQIYDKNTWRRKHASNIFLAKDQRKKLESKYLKHNKMFRYQHEHSQQCWTNVFLFGP